MLLITRKSLLLPGLREAQDFADYELLCCADFEGMPKELLLEAAKILEQQKKAKLFKGTSADDIGIKFFA